MLSFKSRSSRMMLGLVMIATVAACSDDEMTTAPLPSGTPQLAVGDVIPVTNTSGGTGIGSLRWAASLVTDGEVIRFDPSLAGATIVLDTTLHILNKSVTIEGPVDRGITISGGGRYRVLDFVMSSPDTTVLRNVTITGGKVSASGAGIFANYGTLIVENSTITGNQAGGPPAILGYQVTLINSTVSGNQVTAPTYPQPAILGADHVRLINSTVANNGSAGIAGDTLVLRNSILASNSLGYNCGQSVLIIRQGSNVSDDDKCGAPYEITIADPMLGPLANNGGPTLTHALLAGSPAINAGTSCSVAIDQRYVARDAQCDLGAFEFIDHTVVDIGISSSGTVEQKNGWAVVTGTVTCSRNETFDLYVELHQTQKRPGHNAVDIHGVSTTPISCTTSVQPWTIALVTTDGPFESGSATATAATLHAQPWVAPANMSRTIKLIRSRK